MASGPDVGSILKKAHETLDKANNFQKSVTGGKTTPKAEAPKTDYSHAREARKSEGEFMGVQSNQAPEINAALQSREQAKKALKQ